MKLFFRTFWMLGIYGVILFGVLTFLVFNDMPKWLQYLWVIGSGIVMLFLEPVTRSFRKRSKRLF